MSYYIQSFTDHLGITIENILFNDGEHIWAICEGTRFWPDYLKWLEEGNTPEEWNDNAN